MKIKRFSILFLLVFAPVYADSFSVSNSCSKPYKPYEFTDEWELENFKHEVEAYKRCINDFVDEQNDAIRRHRAAGEEALGEWNDFVAFDLN